MALSLEERAAAAARTRRVEFGVHPSVAGHPSAGAATEGARASQGKDAQLAAGRHARRESTWWIYYH
eukprot:828919-Amphidinium_carterae.1